MHVLICAGLKVLKFEGRRSDMNVKVYQLQQRAVLCPCVQKSEGGWIGPNQKYKCATDGNHTNSMGILQNVTPLYLMLQRTQRTDWHLGLCSRTCRESPWAPTTASFGCEKNVWIVGLTAKMHGHAINALYMHSSTRLLTRPPSSVPQHEASNLMRTRDKPSPTTGLFSSVCTRFCSL